MSTDDDGSSSEETSTQDMSDDNEESESMDEGESPDSDNSELENEDEAAEAEHGEDSQSASGRKNQRNGKNLDKEQEKLALAEKDKLKVAQTLYQSNLYRIQISELLAEVAVKAKQRTQVESWYTNFRKWITTVPTVEGLQIESVQQLRQQLNLKKFQLPLPTRFHPSKESNIGTFRWKAPSSIEPVGSWAMNTAVSGISAYDVALEIPKECFNKSDYLNHKYHIKRAFYLSYLGCKLQGRGDVVRFSCPDGNLLRPVLEVDLSSETGLTKPLQIRLHFIPPFDFFKAKRFDSDTNNIRYSYFFHADQDEDAPVLSTPIYNQAILNDIHLVRSHKFAEAQLLSSVSSTTTICEAIKLLKVWLQQRHLNQGYGAFSNYIITMFVCYLAQKEKITETMSTYQIIRVVFVHLTNSDWLTKGVSLNSSQALAQWFLQYDVVFLDSTGLINLTSCMSKYTYERVKKEAQCALSILNSSDVYGFQALFIRDVPFSINFDHILQIKVTPRFLTQLQGSEEHKTTLLSTSGYALPLLISSIGRITEVGLKNRIHFVDFEIPEPPAWQLSELLPPVFNGFMTVRLGMTINRAQAFKLVEKCETEEEAHLEAFKTFWGEKSQLRRFRDGTIVEAVSFDVEQKEHPDSHMCLLMLQYLLKKYLNLNISDEELAVSEQVPFGYCLNNQVENLVDPTFHMTKSVENGEPPPRKKKKRQTESIETVTVSVDDITKQAISALDELGRLLRELEDLPLTITSVQGTSSILRHTNVSPTPPQVYFSSNMLSYRPSTTLHSLHIKESLLDEIKPKIPVYTEPIEVIVHLEGSGKWPDDIDAIRRLKCAFLMRIAQLLQSKGLTVHTNPSNLHIIKDGFVFSIQLTYFRELILLKQLQGEDGILRYRDNLESFQREKSTLLLPKLSSILHSIHSQFTAFGKTCRLAKRWIASHMLLASQHQQSSDLKQPDYCLTEEAVELIVASFFLNYHPYLEPPNEAQIGFLRFLTCLTTTDWKSFAIILNFNDIFAKEDMSSIEADFRKRRATLPTPFISYPDDRLHSVWTKNVLPVVWKRLIALGKQALQVLTTHFNHNCCSVSSSPKIQGVNVVDPFRSIFKPDLSQFDILIWIRKNMNCKKRLSTKELIYGDEGAPKPAQSYKQYIKPSEEVVPIVNFDPVQSYLVELRQNFGHFGLFLHDTYGGEVIAFIWKPDMNKEHEFKISSVKGQVLTQSATSSSPVVAPDMAGLVELFLVLGEGIVDRIQIAGTHEEVKMEKIETEP